MVGRIENILQLEQERAKLEQRKARKIQALVTLLRDPDLEDFVSKLVGESVAKATSQNGTGAQNGLPTAITHAIKFILKELPQPCTNADIKERLKNRGFVFTRDPDVQVRDAMYILSSGERAIFKIKEHGKGGKPNRYVPVVSG